MRDHDNHTIAVSITVRHTMSDEVVEHTHEVVVTDGLDNRAEWRNRRVVAAIEQAAERVFADFGVTAEQAQRGRERDFVTAPRFRDQTPIGG